MTNPLGPPGYSGPPAYGPPPGHGYPPPPPQPYSAQTGYTPPKKSGALKWVLIAVVALVALVVAAGIAVYFGTKRDSTEATEVKSGDCLADIPDSSRVLYVKTVPCDQPHKGEVFAVLPMPDGDFPGEAEVVKYTDKCAPALARYAPAAVDDKAIQLFVLYPTADSWQRGDHTVTCIATSENPRAGKMG
ncbi:septum formation family protein [Mycobacterium sp. NPDC003449]